MAGPQADRPAPELRTLSPELRWRWHVITEPASELHLDFLGPISRGSVLGAFEVAVEVLVRPDHQQVQRVPIQHAVGQQAQ